ncbi:MAG TPA: hypothetical protein VFD30_03365 [Terriglobia bacterium]|nr:hypothetical protein [Terriglobia bacterium]
MDRAHREGPVGGWAVLGVTLGVGVALVVLGLIPINFRAADSKVIISPGTALVVRIIHPLDSENAKMGDRFEGSVVSAISVRGPALIPTGARVEGRCVAVRQGDGDEHPGYLRVVLSGLLDPHGHVWPIETTTVSLWGSPGPLHEEPSSQRKVLADNVAVSRVLSTARDVRENLEAIITPEKTLTFVLLKPAVVASGQ